MKKSFLFYFIIITLSVLGQADAKGDQLLLSQEASSRIFVNNRILAKINGRAISVIDVMKKMDMLFYKQYPQYSASASARFQYYQMQWKDVLQEMIDKELILADAEENKLPLSAGDVRQEMESSFGPNIVTNLDKAGLTFEEAQKMVQDDITIKRMVYIRANSKALKRVTPQMVRAAYDEYAKDKIEPETWEYSVITVRHPNPVQGSLAANSAYRFLVVDKKPLSELTDALKAIEPYGKDTKVTLVEDLHHQNSELSDAYKETLSSLPPESYSQPIASQSRTDKSTVYRIFFLKMHTPEGAIPFEKVADSIENFLLQKVIGEETEAYLERLRKHYNVQESYLKEFTPDDFAPFILH